jgi:hypothetical protein
LSIIFVFFRQDYRKRQKEKEEIEEWKLMSPSKMIQLFNGDPSEFFFDKVEL